MYAQWAITVLVLLLVGPVGCGRDSPSLPPCDAGCGDAGVCLYAREVCVPAPDESGRCPEGYRSDVCGSSSCRECFDCIPACLPNE